VLAGSIPRLADVAPWVPERLTQVIERALQREPAERFASASELAEALEQALPPAPATRLGAFVETYARDVLAERRAIAARLDPGATPAIDAPVAPGQPPYAPPSAGGAPAQPRAMVPREDTQHRLTHTLTSPVLARGPSGARLMLFAGALLVAAGAGVGGAWIAMGRPTPGVRFSSFADRTPRSGPDAFQVASASAPATSPATSGVAPQVEPSAPIADVTDGSSSPPVMPDRMLPTRRTGAAPAASSKPCDPPYFIDAAGIRRVKRDCF
jgi:serine/threonine-protein kinase